MSKRTNSYAICKNVVKVVCVHNNAVYVTFSTITYISNDVLLNWFICEFSTVF